MPNLSARCSTCPFGLVCLGWCGHPFDKKDRTAPRRCPGNGALFLYYDNIFEKRPERQESVFLGRLLCSSALPCTFYQDSLCCPYHSKATAGRSYCMVSDEAKKRGFHEQEPE
jgi:hypothetical protein